ncbi:MAG: hypothetical protein H6819_00340 [Phycisphaerales bacterium]|nr:hypothetical protein [Phycisphaerales bacterium]MCB9857343.1 hypothetical protein [Phycisphaerales bacterium]
MANVSGDEDMGQTNERSQPFGYSRSGAIALGVVALALTVALTGSTCQVSITGDGGTTGGSNTNTAVTPGVLKIQVLTDSIAPAASPLPAADENAPDDVDVNLTPIAYSVAFKRIVLQEFDPIRNETATEFEAFSTDDPDAALVIDLVNDDASALVSADDLPSGIYNKVDIEVFYLDMTVPTLYPGSTSNNINYRMVFEDDGVLQARDFLLYLEPEWFLENTQLGMTVTEAGWYWMDREDPDHVVAVEGATSHPSFPVLDLFANEEFWSSEHKVLEGGVISPELEYDSEAGGVLNIQFDVTEKFNFKDYHDDTTEADGLWEIRKDGGIHPFPPDISSQPQQTDVTNVSITSNAS